MACLIPGLMLACLVLISPAVHAQSGYYVVPWLFVEGSYDDNIFFDTEDEVSDFITRVSPQLDVGYDSANLSWLLSYRNDAEWYRDFSELDSSTARGFGLGQIDYTVNRRWSLRANTEYIQSNSVQDLSLNPGGEIPGVVGRAEAQRMLLSGGSEYRFTPQWIGNVDLTWIDDELEGFTENERLAATTRVEQVLTSARSLFYVYEYRDYEFREIPQDESDPVVTDQEDSHTLWIGLTQALTESSRLELRAGPRFSDGDTEPYLLANWRRDYARGNTTIEALWDETTLLGEVGRLESKSIYGAWTHSFTNSFEVRTGAGFARVEGTGYSSDIAYFDFFGEYRINPYIFLTARYGFNDQDTAMGDPLGRITHNVASLYITFTRARRDPQDS
ncbi:MAG: hypothetical protein V2I57_13290 [Xanthomonadales bacterium]|nr:hypothetical protein [Xanthomonadales bacterium]